MSTMNPWLRLLLCVAGWAFAVICVFSLLAGAHYVFLVTAMVALFIVWPALVYWFRVPRARSIKGQIVHLVLYLTAMVPIGIVAFGLGVLANICMFGFKWKM